jgi:hypothetical protein
VVKPPTSYCKFSLDEIQGPVLVRADEGRVPGTGRKALLFLWVCHHFRPGYMSHLPMSKKQSEACSCSLRTWEAVHSLLS